LQARPSSTLCGLLRGRGVLLRRHDVVLEGKLVDVHSDDFVNGHATHEYRLETVQGTYELRLSDRNPELPRASRVSVHGQRGGNTITVAAGGVQATSTAIAAAPMRGAKTIAVILVNFSDNRTPRPTLRESRLRMRTPSLPTTTRYRKAS
jgi:hypothetical protein